MSEQLQLTLTYINRMSPNGVIQQAFVSMLHNMQADQVSEPIQIVQLLKALCDGLEYENWPN